MRQFPDALNRVELGTIRRQKIERKLRHHLLAPSLVQERMMIFGVVENNDRSFSAPKTLAA